jgi:hypothetical protein
VKQKNAECPLVVIFTLWNYQTKVDILKAQGGKKILKKINGHTTDPDSIPGCVAAGRDQ